MQKREDVTVEDGWKEFIKTFTSVSDRHAPLATKRARAVTLPWLNSEIRALISITEELRKQRLTMTGSFTRT